MTMNYVAVIGTAGRDKSAPLSSALWRAMLDDLRKRLNPDTDVLVSGGAAWADHLAVVAYLEGWCNDLILYLPAPINDDGYAHAFAGARTAAGVANYYHTRFSDLVG